MNTSTHYTGRRVISLPPTGPLVKATASTQCYLCRIVSERGHRAAGAARADWAVSQWAGQPVRTGRGDGAAGLAEDAKDASSRSNWKLNCLFRSSVS